MIIQLDEAKRTLCLYGNRLEHAPYEYPIEVAVFLDEEAYAALETRLGDLFALKRRYGPTLEHVLQTFTEAEARLDDYRRGDEKRNAFRQEAEELQKK